jgi:hypothetical protein
VWQVQNQNQQEAAGLHAFAQTLRATSSLSETELGVCDKNTGRSIKYSEPYQPYSEVKRGKHEKRNKFEGDCQHECDCNRDTGQQ